MADSSNLSSRDCRFIELTMPGRHEAPSYFRGAVILHKAVPQSAIEKDGYQLRKTKSAGKVWGCAGARILTPFIGPFVVYNSVPFVEAGQALAGLVLSLWLFRQCTQCPGHRLLMLIAATIRSSMGVSLCN